jgi:hypothetical protein
MRFLALLSWAASLFFLAMNLRLRQPAGFVGSYVSNSFNAEAELMAWEAMAAKLQQSRRWEIYQKIIPAASAPWI